MFEPIKAASNTVKLADGIMRHHRIIYKYDDRYVVDNMKRYASNNRVEFIAEEFKTYEEALAYFNSLKD